jgi:hypothetical protein
MLAGAAVAQDEDICLFSLKDAPAGAPRFTDFPAKSENVGRRAAPVIATRDERLFRTQLRRGAAHGPIAAGHYAVASWGCGAACRAWSVIDLRTGEVLAPAGAGHFIVDRVDPDDETFGLTFRPDSKLFVLAGVLNEDDRRNGLSYFELENGRFRLIRFYSYANLCKAKGKPVTP